MDEGARDPMNAQLWMKPCLLPALTIAQTRRRVKGFGWCGADSNQTLTMEMALGSVFMNCLHHKG